MTESWQNPGAYNDIVRDTTRVFTGGMLDVSPEAEFDRHVWHAMETLIRAAQSRRHADISDAMEAALGQNLRRLVGLKRALRVGLWCVLTALSSTPLTDEALQDLARRIYPMANSVLTVEERALVLAMGDALRVFDEASPTYSLPEGEFILVSAVACSELLTMAPAVASGLDEIRAQCDVAFSGAQTAAIEEAWLNKIGSRDWRPT